MVIHTGSPNNTPDSGAAWSGRPGTGRPQRRRYRSSVPPRSGTRGLRGRRTSSSTVPGTVSGGDPERRTHAGELVFHNRHRATSDCFRPASTRSTGWSPVIIGKISAMYGATLTAPGVCGRRAVHIRKPIRAHMAAERPSRHRSGRHRVRRTGRSFSRSKRHNRVQSGDSLCREIHRIVDLTLVRITRQHRDAAAPDRCPGSPRPLTPR